MSLRLYIDSADINDWEAWLPSGMFYGVTTNPKLLERANLPCTLPQLEALAKHALTLGVTEIHMQTFGESAEAMIRNGEAIAQLGPKVLVKVPITREGAFAASKLIAQGIPVTVTAVYATHQVATAMALGAHYAAPYLGRMDENGRDGHAAVIAMQRMITALGDEMRLLVASLRHISDIPALMQHGVNTFTLAPSLLPRMFDDPATEAAAAEFERAARGER